ncbi:DNA-dependent ATPase fun30 [Friedmanniomyces endolithicus]|uniref:DNA-dependent ATPase fun30 n=1 Tax=Friedmanniomyces endolithicus TaxID=329885 RepID=A0AAN6KFA3_9PEZI|nr:DNA-dependent ATPase fun30 [Friedmanniomyces endolithicus]KAK0965208.1 DNA-dependent ATPase fun30 [Friedmanniomyces endolithicus]KAK0979800.1 DNA-dependent ATPase fun30 [Friedmanniomyces endolithicus]KAK1040087.1 DNA-dependent ATPase fun30 [Friedmanniomyces endolithicus]
MPVATTIQSASELVAAGTSSASIALNLFHIRSPRLHIDNKPEFDLDDYMCPIKRTTPPAVKAMDYELNDISDYLTRRKIEEMRQIVTESVQRCYAALVRSKGNVKDALLWLAETRTEVRPGRKLAVVVVDIRGSTSQVVERAGSLVLRSNQSEEQRADQEPGPKPEAETDAPVSDDEDPIVVPSSRRKRKKTMES